MPRNKNCKRCPLYLTADHVCVFGRGNESADIMLIGESPGRIGITPAMVETAGIPLRSVYTTAVNKCMTPEGHTPTQQEMSACFPYLAEEIERVKPKVIVCLGGTALYALTGRKVIKDERGKILAPAKHVRTAAKIIVTYAPGSAAYGDRDIKLSAIREDLEFSKRLAGLTKSTLPENKKRLYFEDGSAYEVIGDDDDRDIKTRGVPSLAQTIKELDKSPSIAIDCEWTAGKGEEDFRWPWSPDSELFSISLTGRVNGGMLSAAIAWPQDKKTVRQIQWLFNRKKRFIFHNAMADLIWLRSVGLKVTATDDTQYLAYLLNEEQRLGLKILAPLIAGIEPGWEIEKLFAQRPRTKRGWQDMLDYNANDTYATYLLLEALFQLVKKLTPEERNNIGRAYRKMLIPALPAFVEAAIYGIELDVPELQQRIKEQRERLDVLLYGISELTDIPQRYISKVINSSEQLREWLKSEYGLNVDDVQEATLKPYGSQYPVIGLIAEVKHIQKNLGTYLEPWEYLVTRPNNGNRLRSIYRLDRTRTGRTAVKTERGGGLNLVPRHKWIKALFRASKGKKLIVADYSQAELRMMAWLGPERTMRRLYKEGADLHKTTAAFIEAYKQRHLSQAEFWKEREQWVAGVTPKQRQDAKGVNFGFLFGMQAAKFSAYAKNNYDADFNDEEAEEARDGYMTLYDDLPEYHQRQANRLEVDRENWVVMPSGRYRRNITEVTQMINTPIQTGANDMALVAAARIVQRLEDEFGTKNRPRFVGFIHDSVIIEADEELAERVKQIVKETMEDTAYLETIGWGKIPVKFIADVEIQDTWAA